LLKRALENVIRNAVHYTASATDVDVDLSESPGGWEITVEDQGPGVPEDQVEKIFEPFYRIDEARQRETGGFGLGLSIARRAVEQHGGTIRAHNRRSSSGGLSVVITIPRTDA
jgi:two-component system sensor histidine kinase CpxA